jgi:hypothetical protein
VMTGSSEVRPAPAEAMCLGYRQDSRLPLTYPVLNVTLFKWKGLYHQVAP